MKEVRSRQRRRQTPSFGAGTQRRCCVNSPSPAAEAPPVGLVVYFHIRLQERGKHAPPLTAVEKDPKNPLSNSRQFVVITETESLDPLGAGQDDHRNLTGAIF